LGRGRVGRILSAGAGRIEHMFDGAQRLDPRGLDPRGLDPRGLDPRGLDPRGLDPQALARLAGGIPAEDLLAVVRDPFMDDELPGIDLPGIDPEAVYAAHSAGSEEDRDRLPMGAEEWEPGPVLAVLLSAVDISKLPDSDRVV